ncbi:hypothetical protein PWT90_01076 [Aphanocladium album]|nr:hypothetical protein PWT90_01076 [Aphanocladium album]
MPAAGDDEITNLVADIVAAGPQSPRDAHQARGQQPVVARVRARAAAGGARRTARAHDAAEPAGPGEPGRAPARPVPGDAGVARVRAARRRRAGPRPAQAQHGRAGAAAALARHGVPRAGGAGRAVAGVSGPVQPAGHGGDSAAADASAGPDYEEEACAAFSDSEFTGNDPTLVGLLRVYKDYYPEIIVGEAVRGRASAFKHPDPSWRERLDELQEAHLQQTQERMSRPRDAFRVHKAVGRGQGRKALPTVHTSHATEDSVTLEEIENVQSFVDKMDKLELPNQLVAVLADPLLQKLLLLRPSAESFQRVANWLNAALQDFVDGDADEATLWEVMEVLRDFVVQTKVKLYQHIFQPLEIALGYVQPPCLLELLNMYTGLLHHWASVLRSSKNIPAHASRTITATVQHVSNLALTVLQTNPGLVGESAILEFYEQNWSLLTDDTLKSYIRMELPPSLLIYLLVLSQSLATVARLCHIMASYKEGFESAMKIRGSPDTPTIDASSYTNDEVNRYNGNLLDIVNLHWRRMAFGVQKAVEQGCMLPRTVHARLERYVTSVDRAFSLAEMLSLSYSPIFCLLSIETLRVLEDRLIEEDSTIETRHAGPVSQESLRKLGTSGGIRIGFNGYRASVLETLRDKGFGGVEDLLKISMPPVAKAMKEWQAIKASRREGDPYTAEG